MLDDELLEECELLLLLPLYRRRLPWFRWSLLWAWDDREGDLLPLPLADESRFLLLSGPPSRPAAALSSFLLLLLFLGETETLIAPRLRHFLL